MGLGRLSLAVTLLGLCGTPLTASGEPPLTHDVDGTAIIGGEPTQPDEFVNVVALDIGGIACTGTVVASNLILTAAHCLDDIPVSTPVTVFYGDERLPSQAVGAVDYGAHPEFCEDCRQDRRDYGYIVTEARFNPPYAVPIRTQRAWDATMAVGAEVTVVGFGLDPRATGGASSGVKRKVTASIRRFTDEGLEFVAGGDGADSCRGDSGGPAFVTLPDGTQLLAGVTSRGSKPCGDGGFYGVPYAALCWLHQETGVDLRDAECPSCDCIDTTVSTTEGCHVAVPPRPESRVPVSLALLLLFARRRRG